MEVVTDLWHPPGAIAPEKVLRHNGKAQGQFVGDRHCPLRKQVLYNVVKTQGFL